MRPDFERRCNSTEPRLGSKCRGVAAALGVGKRPAVRVTVNGFQFDTTLGVRHGASKIPVSAERRQAAEVAAGDVLEVGIQLR